MVETYGSLEAGNKWRLGTSLRPGLYQLVVVFEDGSQEILKLRKH